MKKKTWLIGKSCAGKTHWSQEQKRRDEHVCVINVGILCRSEFGTEKMSKMKNPDHPKETEAFVRAEIKKRLGTAEADPGVHSIIIDGAPRTPEQVQWVAGLPGYHRIVWIVCPEPLRQERIIRETSDRQQLSFARELDANKNLLAVLSDIAFYKNLGLYTFRACGEMSIDFAPVGGTALAEIFHEHKLLVDRTLGMSDMPYSADRLINLLPQGLRPLTAMNSHVVWLQRFLDAMRVEVEELDELIPKKWWSLAEMDVVKAREELIDIWHFIFSIGMALGMDAEALVDEYRRKNEINHRRINTGYKG